MSHFHPHHAHAQVPMVGNLSRGQFAKIVFPVALSLIIFVAYSILVHIYSLNLDTRQLPTDAVLFCVVWTLLLCSFLRGAFASPGLVQTGWYKLYPAMQENLKMRYKIYKEQMKHQKEMMKRFQLNKQRAACEHQNGNTCDHDHGDNHNEETRLLIEHKQDEDEDTDKEDIIPDNFARPPRSHYCHELESNVLRMDHFCVWFNNAVGLFNYKFFLLTIVYLLAASVLSLYILIYRVFVSRLDNASEFGIWNTICLLLTAIICLFFTVFAGMHSSMHVWQMSKNLTSIECHKYMQIKAMAKHFKLEFVNTHEFDDGLFDNCKKMLGGDVWFWLLPIAPSLPEDGYQFHVNLENKARIESLTKLMQAEREKQWKANKLGAQAKRTTSV
eukprot:500949_1